MCDPISIAGAAMSAGSMLLNQQAAAKQAKAREGAMTAERIRQSGLRQEATALNNTSRDRYNDFQGQEEQKATALADFFKSRGDAAPVPGGATPNETAGAMPTSSNTVVTNEVTKQGAKADAFGRQQDEALGALRGFGDLLADTSRLQARDAAQIGMLGGLMKGSSGVLPYELEAANNKGAGTKMFADILGGAGGLAVNYGLGGGSDKLFGTKVGGITADAYGPQLPGVGAERIVPGSGSFGNLFKPLYAGG